MKSKVKYVPSGWKISGDYVVDGEGNAVAEYTNPAIIKEDEQANARLIAAAPELLEACKRINIELSYLNVNDLNNSTVEAWNMIDAAISKAEGK